LLICPLRPLCLRGGFTRRSRWKGFLSPRSSMNTGVANHLAAAVEKNFIRRLP
jgi:hypothetical protein